MDPKDCSSKVISLTERIKDHKNMSERINERTSDSNTRVIAITSGKGGVGKTNIVANLGFELCRLKKKVLIFDADLGLGNLDVLLGIAPQYNLSHVILGEKDISEIIVEGPGNIKILPASSGIQEVTRLTEDQRILILSELESLIDSFDVLLIDTAAGISSNVLYFNVTAQEILVVVSPEPTSITDAYALMKILSKRYSEKHFNLVVNMAASALEGQEVFNQLTVVADRFLDISIKYMGHVLLDKNLTKCVRRQKAVCELFPDTEASKCLTALAKNLLKSNPPEVLTGNNRSLWKDILQNKFD